MGCGKWIHANVTSVGFCLTIGNMATTHTGSPFTLLMPMFSLTHQAFCRHTYTHSIVVNPKGVWNLSQASF